MAIYFNYLPEAFCLALNPLLYFLSPVNRVVTGVWSQISAGGNTHRWISLFSDWLRELLRSHGEDLIHKNKSTRAISLVITHVAIIQNKSLDVFVEGTQLLFTSKISSRWRRL